jgi:hypothetical protein
MLSLSTSGFVHWLVFLVHMAMRGSLTGEDWAQIVLTLLLTHHDVGGKETVQVSQGQDRTALQGVVESHCRLPAPSS